MPCLMKQYADAFREGLKKGEIDPDELLKMNSEERRTFLGKYVGAENAKWVNTQFESKVLLKNQKQGMVTWAKSVANLKEEVKKDLIKKIEKLDKALNPEEESLFLSDLIERRLGIQITQEEAKTITDLTSQMKKYYEGRFEDPDKTYFRLKKQLVDFMRDRSPVIKADLLSEGLSVLRAIKTGFDLSASLRQGASYFGTKQWSGAFSRMLGYAHDKVNFDELEIKMMSHPRSDIALKVKRDLGLTMLGESFTQREEAFASKLISKIPLLSGSERAYEGFLNDLRFNRFVDTLEILDNAGRSINDNNQALKDLAHVIAAASGRGTLGSAEGAAKSLATVLFSPRWVASRIQVLTNPLTKTGPARKEAALALARMAGIIVSIAGLAKAAGVDIETDPTSNDFLKLKIGNTRYDYSGGLLPYIVLMSRILTMKVKSTLTKKITKLNTGEFTARTAWDVATSFLENKMSPLFGAIRDIMQGRTVDGQVIDFENKPKEAIKVVADNIVTPLLAADVVDAFRESADNKIVNAVAAGTASLFGISVSTYIMKPQTKEWTQFKEEKGEEAYQRASVQLTKEFNEELTKLEASEEYQNAPDTSDKDSRMTSKADMITKLKKNVEKKVLREIR